MFEQSTRVKNCSQLNVQNVKLVVYYEHEASDYSSAMQLQVEGVDCEVGGYCLLIFCLTAARWLPGTALQTEEGQMDIGRNEHCGARPH